MRLQNEITFIGFIGRTCICLCCFPLSFCKDFSGSPTIIFYSQFFFAILFYASQFWWDDLSRSQYRWDCHVMSCHVSSPSPLLLLFPRCPSCCSVLLASTGGGSIHFTLLSFSPFFTIRRGCQTHPYYLHLHISSFPITTFAQDSHHTSPSLLFKRGEPVEGFGGIMMIGK